MRKVDGQKINKRGGSNKGMADGFFFKINKHGIMSIREYRVGDCYYIFIYGAAYRS